MALNYLASLSYYVPELLASVTMFALILLEATYKDNSGERKLLYLTSYIGLVSVCVYLFLGLHKEGVSIFTDSVVIDSFSTMAKIIMTLGTIGAIYLSSQSNDIEKPVKAEFPIMTIGVLIGGMLLASANNMLILYIGIETLSILSYVLASFKKNDERSSEAGLKYSLYGGISAGIMLFGMSHIFGVLGSINFTEMVKAMSSLGTTEIAILLPAFVLFLAGLGYKIACVPFHMWSPDVYEGSPIPVTAFFSIVPKIAGITALVRISMVLFGDTTSLMSIGWVGVLSVVGALTMTVGNVSAIGQRSVKRMLAYSSISHAGMMLMGVVVLSEIGARSILFYGVTYLFMTLVAFFVVSFINDKYGNDHFERFDGLVFKHPLMAIVTCIVMFSLAGIPPFSGFIAKFHIFTALISKQYYVLAIIAGLNSVVSVYYYLKLVRIMVFKPVESEDKVKGFNIQNQGVILALTIPVISLGLFWEKIILLADGAKIYIQ
jgi:NADH-quinone oxidoreductase subunit N